MQDSAQLWKEREVIFSQFAGLVQVGQNVCLSRRRSLRPKPFWLSKSDRLDYLRYADFPLLIPISWHGLLPGCRQLAQNLIFTLPRTPFAQVSYIDSRSSRTEDGMRFPGRQVLRILSFAFGSSFISSLNRLTDDSA